MDKRGFTLIELLACITIMTLIATMACINITKSYANNEIEEQKRKEEIITSAACVYIELHKNIELKKECLKAGCDISSNDLIKEGLIDEEDVDKSKVIHIEMQNNEKKCIIK